MVQIALGIVLLIVLVIPATLESSAMRLTTVLESIVVGMECVWMVMSPSSVSVILATVEHSVMNQKR